MVVSHRVGFRPRHDGARSRLAGADYRGAPPAPGQGAGVRTAAKHRVRVSTEFPVLIYDGVVASHCHAVELSSTGIVLERGRSRSAPDRRSSVRLELFLDHAPRPVRVLARPVRWFGTREAYKFTTITDADRLTLTEHLDRVLSPG